MATLDSFVLRPVLKKFSVLLGCYIIKFLLSISCEYLMMYTDTDEIGVLSESSTKTVEWRIENFSSYTETEAGFKSPPFRVSDYSWCMIIFPNGVSTEWKSFVSLYFNEDDTVKKNFVPAPIHVDLTYCVKTIRGEDLNKREDMWKINKNGWVGYENFIERAKLFKKKQELLPSDTLTIRCWAQVKDKMPDMVTRLYQLAANFKDLFISQKNTDISIEVKGKVFSANKYILAARSPVLAAMFESDMTEKKTGIVNIVDCDPNAFYTFLLYLYSGELSFSNCHVFDLYKIADKYDVSELKLICVDFMIRRLTVYNICETFVFAHNFSDEKLLTSIQVYFEENFNKIVSSSGWKKLIENDGHLANNLLIKMAPKVNIKNDFY